MASVMLNQHSAAGFYKTPVCKGLLGTMFLTCSVIHVPMANRLRQYLVCQIPSILQTPQIWRILFNRMTFIHTKDLICSVLIVYCFRILERRMSSRKFSSFILGSCVFATVLEILSIMLLNHFGFDYHSGGYLPPGMYGVIFPLFVSYFLDIPRITGSRFLGVPVSGKTLTYLLGLQVASTSTATMVSALCGILGGVLYRINFLKANRWLIIPNVLCGFCDRIFGWALRSNEPKYQPMGATLELQRQEQADLWEQQYLYTRAQDYRNARPQRYANPNEMRPADGGFFGSLFNNRHGRAERLIEPSDDNIQVLVNMGFDRTEATEALRASSNDLVAATSILLRG